MITALTGPTVFVINRVPGRALIIRGFIATTTVHGMTMIAAPVMPEGLPHAYTILGCA